MFKQTVLARALAIAFSTAALTAALPQQVLAQSSATGNIGGQVSAPAGATIVITNMENGAKRTIVPEASGNYRMTALPAGHYKVELLRQDKVAGSQEVDVLIGQGVDASFIDAAADTQTVRIKGRKSRIDVTNTNNGAVFTSKELAKLPLASNLTAVTLLAPNTTRGDPTFGGTSFGGGGVSENAYYINGFPVTNPLSQVGGAELPFGAIAQTSVITGGYGAEFGRSIGGVLNVTTKSGTNNWEVGATLSVTPNSLRAKQVNIDFPKTGSPDNAATDGKLHFRRDTSSRSETQYGFFLGGPIVENKVFMFIAADNIVTKRGESNSQTDPALATQGWNDIKSENRRYLLKFDWNLSDSHRLEWTTVSDLTDQTNKVYGVNPATGRSNGVKYSSYVDQNPGSRGATSNFLKYTGNLTDKLTLTSVYGESRAPRKQVFEDYDVNGQLFAVTSSETGRVPEIGDSRYIGAQKFGNLGLIQLPGHDGIKSFRLDLEYKLGDHTLRAGLDQNKLKSVNAGVISVGGGSWNYDKVESGSENTEVNLPSGPAIVGNFGGYGRAGYYVTKTLYTTTTNASAEQSAQYIEDRFQITKNLLLIGGLRNEQYSNSNGDGVKFIDVKNQIAPRFSASWDVYGDQSLKVFGSAGRYYLQLPTQIAARAASRSTLTYQDFTYTGVDAQGLPTGLNAIGPAVSPDNEYGQAKDPRSVVVKNLKPNYQDEITLGFEKAYSPDLNFGVKATYRTLGAGIDDTCDTRKLRAYARANNIPVTAANIPCYIFNPGEDATIFLIDNNGVGRYVSFTAAQLGYPKIERKYTALDFFLEHPLRNNWYGKFNYTWSRSKGNTEGQTRSDTGQAEIGTSALFDFPELTPGQNGLLPNDRTHQIKAYGFYELTPEWSIGANLLMQSGRPKVCLGTNAPVDANLGYRTEYYFCGGKPVPRGSIGRLPFEKQLDLSFTYKPNLLKGFSFKADIFNVFDSQTRLTRREAYDNGSGEGILATYDETRTTIAPRSVKLTMEYSKKF